MNATSASPVQSMMRSARIAARPDFDSVITPLTVLPLMMTSTTAMCSSGLTPASAMRWSATSLNCSPSRHCESLYGHFVVPPMRSAARSISRPIPSVSEVPSYLYQPSVSMPTVEITPPKHPNRSTNKTSAPAFLAAMAAESPDGPPPTTRTWQRSKTGTSLDGCTTWPARISILAEATSVDFLMCTWSATCRGEVLSDFSCVHRDTMRSTRFS
mmetsp:Transcript_34069/g.90801  ORF Transcript_34069/g.90801 Transcript_34069/m.90801 type:complete len:214 (+) Transcript_34069:1190-1831(+)